MNFILGMIHRRRISYHVITSGTIATRLLCQHSGFLKLQSKKNNVKHIFSISEHFFFFLQFNWPNRKWSWFQVIGHFKFIRHFILITSKGMNEFGPNLVTTEVIKR